MGMYTGLKLDVTVNPTKEAEDVLKYMLDREGELKEPKLPDHDLFKTQRWGWMFRGTSTYLEPFFEPNSYLKDNRLHVCFNIKNYTSEIDEFLDWIAQYVTELHEGFWQYEEMPGPVPITLQKKLVKPDKHENYEF